MEKIRKFFKKIFNVQPILNTFDNGQMVRRVLGTVFQIFAVVQAVVMLYYWARSWPVIDQLKFSGGLGFLIWQIVVLFAIAYALILFIKRTDAIKSDDSSDYIVVPAFAKLIKAAGETVFTFLGIISIPALFVVWLGGYGVIHYMPVVDMGHVFITGIAVFILAWVIGFLVLLFCYLLSEFSLVIFKIADDVKGKR